LGGTLSTSIRGNFAVSGEFLVQPVYCCYCYCYRGFEVAIAEAVSRFRFTVKVGFDLGLGPATHSPELGCCLAPIWGRERSIHRSFFFPLFFWSKPTSAIIIFIYLFFPAWEPLACPGTRGACTQESCSTIPLKGTNEVRDGGFPRKGKFFSSFAVGTGSGSEVQ
jgi:hypothetical protein